MKIYFDSDYYDGGRPRCKDCHYNDCTCNECSFNECYYEHSEDDGGKE